MGVVPISGTGASSGEDSPSTSEGTLSGKSGASTGTVAVGTISPVEDPSVTEISGVESSVTEACGGAWSSDDVSSTDGTGVLSGADVVASIDGATVLSGSEGVDSVGEDTVLSALAVVSFGLSFCRRPVQEVADSNINMHSNREVSFKCFFFINVTAFLWNVYRFELM